jgi:hypothetical protein
VVPEDRKRFDLGDYVEVKDRIARLFEYFPQARIETSYELTSAPDDKPKVICRAFVYRTPEYQRPSGHGTSWLYLPGTTPYTRGSEIENAETSAVGRAIGMLGILIDKSIASANEIENKRDDSPSAPAQPEKTPEGGLIGTAIAQGNHDFNLRQTPDGWALPFRVKNGSTSFIVRAENDLAQALDAIKATVIDQRVQVWGTWKPQTTPVKGTRPAVNYRILVLERIATPDGILPAPAWDNDEPPLEEPPDDLPLIGEAPSEELGLVAS